MVEYYCKYSLLDQIIKYFGPYVLSGGPLKKRLKNWSKLFIEMVRLGNPVEKKNQRYYREDLWFLLFLFFSQDYLT